MNNPEYYEKLTDYIIDLIAEKLGDGFNISYTGTVNPRFYKGHMKMAEIAGLKIYINQKGHKVHPTMKQIEDYFGKFK